LLDIKQKFRKIGKEGFPVTIESIIADRNTQMLTF